MSLIISVAARLRLYFVVVEYAPHAAVKEIGFWRKKWQ